MPALNVQSRDVNLANCYHATALARFDRCCAHRLRIPPLEEFRGALVARHTSGWIRAPRNNARRTRAAETIEAAEQLPRKHANGRWTKRKNIPHDGSRLLSELKVKRRQWPQSPLGFISMRKGTLPGEQRRASFLLGAGILALRFVRTGARPRDCVQFAPMRNAIGHEARVGSWARIPSFRRF